MIYLKKYWKEISIGVLLLAISFVLSMKSDYNAFLRGAVGNTDGNVFRCIGWLMTKGYVPYRDVFDHKGPFLYFIQYIATFLGQVRGIWPFEIVFLLGSVVISYLFARKFNNRLLSIFVILLTFSLWHIYGTGNHTEEFSVLFQLVSIYYFVDFFLHKSNWVWEISTNKAIEYSFRFRNRWFDFRVCIIGICFACTFLIKANCCAVWIVFCLAILIDCIKNRYWESSKRFFLSFLIGAFIITLPIILYLHINNAIQDFIWDYFRYNALYSSEISWANMKTRTNAFFYFTNTIPWLLAFMVMIYKITRKDNYFKWDVIYVIFMLTIVFLSTMAGRTWNHMGMAIIPSFIYPFSILFSMLTDYKNKNEKLAMVLAGYLVITCIYPSWSTQITKAAGDINKYVNEPKNIGMRNNDVVQYIKKHTKKEDKISVLGIRCEYYLYVEREPASKYIFIPPPSVDKGIVDEYISDLENSLPKIIVVGSEYKGGNAWVKDKMDIFLESHGYELVLKGNPSVYQHK